MELFLIILSLLWSILVIVLFFKIWMMTNDVHIIKDSIETGNYDSSQRDIIERFALAFAQSLISKEIEKTHPQEFSFDSIQSIDICTTGGYFVVSDWMITDKSNFEPKRNTLRATLVCNHMLNFMKPESWEAKII